MNPSDFRNMNEALELTKNNLENSLRTVMHSLERFKSRVDTLPSPEVPQDVEAAAMLHYEKIKSLPGHSTTNAWLEYEGFKAGANFALSLNPPAPKDGGVAELNKSERTALDAAEKFFAARESSDFGICSCLGGPYNELHDALIALSETRSAMKGSKDE